MTAKGTPAASCRRVEEAARFSNAQARPGLNVGGHHGVSFPVVQTISARRPGRFVAASRGGLDAIV